MIKISNKRIKSDFFNLYYGDSIRMPFTLVQSADSVQIVSHGKLTNKKVWMFEFDGNPDSSLQFILRLNRNEHCYFVYLVDQDSCVCRDYGFIPLSSISNL